ncbi:MAG: glycerophosphodiester phosphodiesterase [Rhodobacteraceae bacterium]|nr:MAG: glycerophosphodiester phosphodiesterase [Paracoccaceae bacterium]
MTPNPFRSPHGAPIIYGHRGARGVLPENTMASFRYLRGTGAQGLEIDVQNAASHVPVVVHDPCVPMQLARGPNGKWMCAAGPKIRDLSLAQLQSYDVGRLNPDHAYGNSYPDQQPRDGERIPGLEQVLDWATGEDGLILNIEIKSYATRDDLGDPPAMLVEALLQALARHRMPGEVLVSSFDWRVLDEVQCQAPDLARGYLTYEQPGEHLTVFEGSPWMAGLSLAQHGNNLPGLIAAQGGRCWCAHHRDLTEVRIRQAHEVGVAVNAWTVNAPEDIARLVAWGIDGIITDYPSRGARHGSRGTG